jgi:aspartate/methionine/tyrosine aminotransferase
MSGVQKVFELGRSLKDPVDLSIGQPHFSVPDPIKTAAKAAIDADHNGYTVTQGIPALRAKIGAWLTDKYHHADRDVIITSGTSGGMLLATLASVNPGDEVILFDPYFVGYPPMISLCRGTPIIIDTYPDFQINVDRVKLAITPKTKTVLFNAPANPTGAVPSREIVHDLAELCDQHGILLISDEIYRAFTYDTVPVSPAEYNPNTLVVDGFGKSYGFTGWRLGFAHGPKPIIKEMAKLQQFTFTCAPSMVQHAGIAAWDCDISPMVADYRRKRDRLVNALRGVYEFTTPGGAFYVFAKSPHGTASEFVNRAIENDLILIPGNLYSQRDTHFRISYAVKDETLDRGIEILLKLAR